MNIRKLTGLFIIAAAWMPSMWAQTTDATHSSKQAIEATAGHYIPADSLASYTIVDYDSPKSYIIENIEVKGVNYLIPDIIIATSGLRRGDVITIPGAALSNAMTKLWDQRYFSDVNIVAQPVGEGGVNLEIYLQERPRIYKWSFEGVSKSKAETLQEEMKLRKGTELSDYVLEKNILLIKKHFAGKGFLNTEVGTRIENDPVIKNGVNVTFIIDRNKRVKIGEIVFEGNNNFSDRRLRRTMKKTHQVNVNFFQSFKLNETDYETDKDNLIDFYNSEGYRNAAIVSDSIYTLSEKRIGIKIDLDEGHQYFIRDVKWTGNTVFPTEFLENVFGVKKGDSYDKKLIDKRLGIGKEEDFEDPTQIKSMYQNQGYLFSMIEPAEFVERDSIDLDIKIFEGRPFTINNVDISGNYKLNDEVVRRSVYTRPGELYNRSLILRTLRELSQTQLFDAANTVPMPTPISSELVDISWALSEMAGDKFDISAGFGQNMFIGSVGIQLTNLAIQDIFKKGAWRPYPNGKGQQFMIRGQTNGTWYSSLSASFTEPWLGGRKPNSLTVSAYYSKQTDSQNWWGTKTDVTQHLISSGVSAGLGRRLSFPDHYFTLYNELAYQRYDLMNYSYYFPIKDGKSNVLSLRTVLGRNTLNQYIYPSSGTEFSLSLSLTPPYSLFDGIDYKSIDKYNNEYELGIGGTKEQYDANNSKRYKWVEYHKWMAKVAWYYPLSRDQKLVLMAKAELGYLGHYNKYKVSPFEGFSVGGDGMSGGYYVPGMDLIALRGYDDGTLTPTYASSGINVDNARVYNKYTVELRYPVLMQPGTSVWVLAFAEGGNGFMSWKDFNPFSIKRSLGIGVRFYVPVFGLIGIDWAYGFDVPYGATKRNGGKLHFTMGMQF